jgi:predicted phage tail protein
MSETTKKPTGTVQIVIGALLVAWGLMSGLYNATQMAGQEGSGIAFVVSILMIAGGIWLLVAGIIKKARQSA